MYATRYNKFYILRAINKYLYNKVPNLVSDPKEHYTETLISTGLLTALAIIKIIEHALKKSLT